MPINVLLCLQVRSLQMTAETRLRRPRMHDKKIPLAGVCVCVCVGVCVCVWKRLYMATDSACIPC